ncbi:hypothetical protein HPB48_016334 [Haemaphysalis longicornis]|uniref:Transposase Tc1-like domain-containing protein n=1 Tax=Haemaphysalis longicornis TaxID=44386 RepID=A0A9J6H257_HAELO|nr:hypothetical protein HPB48_016334 [Haemaphysalis longicornis]
MTNRPLSTINRIVQAYRKERRINDAPCKARPKVTTEDEDMAIVTAVADGRTATAREIKNSAGLDVVSATTVKRRLPEAGLKSRAAVQKPIVSEANKQKRLEFAREHQQWTEDHWGKVVFTDESTFTTRSQPTYKRELSEVARTICQMAAEKDGTAETTANLCGAIITKARSSDFADSLLDWCLVWFVRRDDLLPRRLLEAEEQVSGNTAPSRYCWTAFVGFLAELVKVFENGGRSGAGQGWKSTTHPFLLASMFCSCVEVMLCSPAEDSLREASIHSVVAMRRILFLAALPVFFLSN